MPRSTQRPCLQGHAQPSRADGRGMLDRASETTTVSNRTELGTPRHHTPRKRTQTEGGVITKDEGNQNARSVKSVVKGMQDRKYRPSDGSAVMGHNSEKQIPRVHGDVLQG